MKKLIAVFFCLMLGFPLAALDIKDAPVLNSLAKYAKNNLVMPSDLSNTAALVSIMQTYPVTAGDVYVLNVVFLSNSMGLNNLSNLPVAVEEDGTMDLPFLGKIKAIGQSAEQLSRFVTKSILAKVPAQTAALTLKLPAVFNVHISGAVDVPGFVKVAPSTTLLDAIALAGFFKAGASYRKVTLERAGKTILCDLSRFVFEGDSTQNPLVQKGDKIIVATAYGYAQIKGNVVTPGYYEITTEDNALALLLISGGPMPGSDPVIQYLSMLGDNLSKNYASSELKNIHPLHGDVLIVNSENYKIKTVFASGAFQGAAVETFLSTGQASANAANTAVPDLTKAKIIPWSQGMTVGQVIDILGGPVIYADLTRAFLYKNATGEKIPVDVKGLFDKLSDIADPVMDPDDFLYLPFQNLNIFITGFVISPKSVGYIPGLTARDYILLAGGVDPTNGDLNALYTVDQNGKQKKIHPGDILLPGTILFVGPNGWKVFTETMDNGFKILSYATTLASAAILLSQVIALFK